MVRPRMFAASRGGLLAAVSAFSATQPRYVGILTGFYVPRGSPPAAETDGPAGAALLALALSRIGVRCRLLYRCDLPIRLRGGFDRSGTGRCADRRRGAGCRACCR